MEIVDEKLIDSLEKTYSFREIVISKSHSTYTLQTEGINLAGYTEKISDIKVAIMDHILIDESKRSRGVALKALKTLEDKLKTMNTEYLFAYFDQSQTVQFLLTCGFSRFVSKELERESLIFLNTYLRENLSFKTLLYKKLK